MTSRQTQADAVFLFAPGNMMHFPYFLPSLGIYKAAGSSNGAANPVPILTGRAMAEGKIKCTAENANKYYLEKLFKRNFCSGLPGSIATERYYTSREQWTF